MKKALEAVVLAAVLGAASAARATPSTVVWTPATTYTQPYLVPHITYDTYFGERVNYPTDVGITMGFVPDNKWVEGEIGVDAFYSLSQSPPDSSGVPGPYATKNAFQFNGKLSLKEGAVHAHAPGLSVGAYGLGLTKDLNDFNLLYAVLGKTFGDYGSVGLGYYQGNDKLLLKIPSATSGAAPSKSASGVIASYASPKVPINRVGLKDVSFGVDYQSGESAFGALGAAATFYFNDLVSLLTGPVFFNHKESALNAQGFVWTVQLDVDLDFAKPQPKK